MYVKSLPITAALAAHFNERGPEMNTVKKKILKTICLALVMIFVFSGLGPIMAAPTVTERQPSEDGALTFLETSGASPLDNDTFLTEDGILLVEDDNPPPNGGLNPQLDPPRRGDGIGSNLTVGGMISRPATENCLPTPDLNFPFAEGSLTPPAEDMRQNFIYSDTLPLPEPGSYSNIETSSAGTMTFYYSGNWNSSGSAPASHWINTPGTITLRYPINLVRQSFRYEGWWSWDGHVRQPGTTFFYGAGVSGYVQFFAHWVPAVTVEYLGNWETTGTVPVMHAADHSGRITLGYPHNLTRTGFVFSGWRDYSRGIVYQPGQTINFGYGAQRHVVLHAYWRPMAINEPPVLINAITLQFDGNGNTGGTVPTPIIVFTPGHRDLPGPGNMTRVGFEFIGWRCSSGHNWSAGSRINFNIASSGLLTFTARWRVVTIPTITNPATNNVQLPLQNLTVRWNAPSGSGFIYTIAMRNITQDPHSRYPPIMTERIVNTNSFTIPQHYFTAGNQYRIAVSAGLSGDRNAWRWSERTFFIQTPAQPGITVTVRNANNQPISGAVVQFVRSTSPAEGPVTSFRTGSNGTVFFANALPGTYGINVTHPNYASTSATTRRITRAAANQAQNESFTMGESSAALRNLGWRPILEDMRTPANPRYRISSVYGYREWTGNPLNIHVGIDIVENVAGGGLGRRVHSAFAGTVAHVYTNRYGSAGYGIVIRYTHNGTAWYVRYLHLRNLPARANGTRLHAGNTVSAGEQIGFLGNTPPGTGAHLHIDVHRNFDPRNGGNFSRSIDPRAFFADGFVSPWPQLNIR